MGRKRTAEWRKRRPLGAVGGRYRAAEPFECGAHFFSSIFLRFFVNGFGIACVVRCAGGAAGSQAARGRMQASGGAFGGG